MGRNKITDEARKQASNQEPEQDTQDPDSKQEKQLTQRMPQHLVDDVDDWREKMGGMSRNAAINMLVTDSLRNRGELSE